IGRSATSWRVVLPAPSPREIHARNFRIGDAPPDWPKSAPPGTAIVAPPAAAAATLCFNNFRRDNAEFFVPTSYSLCGIESSAALWEKSRRDRLRAELD